MDTNQELTEAEDTKIYVLLCVIYFIRGFASIVLGIALYLLINSIQSYFNIGPYALTPGHEAESLNALVTIFTFIGLVIAWGIGIVIVALSLLPQTFISKVQKNYNFKISYIISGVIMAIIASLTVVYLYIASS